jgi:RNA polymerase sigma-70 factor (ECF subfamily)
MQIAWPGTTGREDLAQRELITLAKQRDSAAWSSIYSQHYDSIFRYVYGRLGRREEAEDLAAQVFLEALQHIDSFVDTGKPLAAWLFGIARNLANNNVRRSKRVENRESLEDEDLEPVNGHVSGPSAESLDLLAGLDKLTKDQKEVIVLRFFVGLSAKETGEIVGKTELAVYALQVRALVALRKQIGDETDLPRESVA